MPPKRLRKVISTPIESAMSSVEHNLPDPHVNRMPYYCFFSEQPEGVWLVLLNDCIKDRINDALVLNRKNRIKYSIESDPDVNAGISVSTELMSCWLMRHGTKNFEKIEILRNKTTPVLVSMAYYTRSKDTPVSDMHMLQIVYPTPRHIERNLDGVTRGFIVYNTNFFNRLGYDPLKNNQIPYYPEDPDKEATYESIPTTLTSRIFA